MGKFINQNKYPLVILLFIFVYYNFRIINNFGIYNDDWLFYGKDGLNFKDWAVRVWVGEGLEIRRHVLVPFYIFLHLFPYKIIYFLSFIFSLIIFGLIFFLLTKLIKNNFSKKINSEINLTVIVLILSWYFFPFNMGGQFWITAIIHTKIATIFFLIHLIFLINKRIFFSLIFLILCFNSYEIYFFLYVPIILIFFYKKLIDKIILNKYLIYSFFIQIFFLIDKKRVSQELDLIKILNIFFENFLRFFWSIYSSIPEHFNVLFKIFILIILFLVFTSILNNFFDESKKNKKFKIIALICILFSLGLNSLVHAIGTYGYWGKGIFSRTMYIPSLLILFSLIIFLPSFKKKNGLFTSYIIFFITIFFFHIEIKNWEVSKKIQEKIVKNYFITENNFSNSERNLILFFGPCYYNGVEIFSATYDLQNAIIFKDKDFYKNNLIVPIQNWQIKNVNESTFVIHIFDWQINDWNNIYFWDYFEDKVYNIKNSSASYIVSQILSYRHNRTCSINNDEFLRANKAKSYFINFFKFNI